MSNRAQMTQMPEGIGPVWTIGRHEACTVRRSADSVSRMHAEVSYTAAEGWSVKDLGSTNGTVVKPREGAPWELVPGVGYSIEGGDRIFFGPDASLRPRDLPWP